MTDETRRFVSFSLHTKTHTIDIAGVTTQLDQATFAVLQTLIDRAEVVASADLIAQAFGSAGASEKTLQRCIATLRKLLGPAALLTVAGQGYRLTVLPLGTVAPAPAPSHPLPEARRRLFGRDADLAALIAMHGNHRLVSIVGPGGVGKTSLVGAVTAELRARGLKVQQANLASVGEITHILPLVASVLGVSAGNSSLIDAIILAIASREITLVLDNCEHLSDGAADVALALLSKAPLLRIIVTSQVAMALGDERVYWLAPLAVPTAGAPLEQRRNTASVLLFEERARALNQHFTVDAQNVDAIGEICRSLDGLPLALELAAARVRLLGVEGVRARLSERLNLLTVGPRDQPDRQKSLRATLAWSHELLSPEQQRVFRRLGAFAGSFSMDAAEAICADANLDGWAVLDAVAVLVNKSLLSAEGFAGGAPRFRLLETMRLFAQEQLADAAEQVLMRAQHLNYYLALAETAAPHLSSATQAEWHSRLNPDLENFFAAHHACDQNEAGVEKGLLLANALARYWMNRSAVVQGEQVYEEAIARPGAAAYPHLLAQATLQCGWYHSLRNRHEAAIDKFERAITIARPIGEISVVAFALARSGYAWTCLGDRARARTLLEEAKVLSDVIDSPTLTRVSYTLLAELERVEGHYAVALELYATVNNINVALQDLMSQMIALNNLAWSALALGDLAATRTHAEESLAVSDQLDSRRGRWIVMEICASLAAELGEWECAARFDAAAALHTAQMGRHRDVADEALLVSRLEMARLTMGQAAYGEAQESGRALSQDAALNELRDWLVAHPPARFAAIADSGLKSAGRHGAVAEADPDAEDAESITPREREVVSLVARGYNNADIAKLMGISVLTVRTHRQRLMQKLNLRNAAEITALAVRLGIYNPG
jgi:predicted ATPase/DNA-binding CsgD family transcriptional regulator/DNA-binding winged helix-turn-helix (wHTH) protein